MKRPAVLAAAAAIVAAAVYVVVRSTPEPTVAAVSTESKQTESAGLCPWRTPDADLRAFFPGATGYERRLLILSDLHSDVVKLLGPKMPIDANGIYYYRIMKSGKRVGGVIAQRTPGEYGVVEYVAAFDDQGRIAGVKIQRLREPDSTAKAITSTAWLKSFNGKDEHSVLNLGSDIPHVNQEATVTAQSLTESIRRLTIEYDVALAHGR
jgi:hypothetical protein